MRHNPSLFILAPSFYGWMRRPSLWLAQVQQLDAKTPAQEQPNLLYYLKVEGIYFLHCSQRFLDLGKLSGKLILHQSETFWKIEHFLILIVSEMQFTLLFHNQGYAVPSNGQKCDYF